MTQTMTTRPTKAARPVTPSSVEAVSAPAPAAPSVFYQSLEERLAADAAYTAACNNLSGLEAKAADIAREIEQTKQAERHDAAALLAGTDAPTTREKVARLEDRRASVQQAIVLQRDVKARARRDVCERMRRAMGPEYKQAEAVVIACAAALVDAEDRRRDINHKADELSAPFACGVAVPPEFYSWCRAICARGR